MFQPVLDHYQVTAEQNQQRRQEEGWENVAAIIGSIEERKKEKERGKQKKNEDRK